jgi:phage terminase large subunit
MTLNLSPAAQDALMRDVFREAKRRAEMKRMASGGFEFRNANQIAQTNHDRELILAGPAGTGKSLANLNYINRQMWKYPRLRVLCVRKVRADLAESILVTYERDILGYDNPICGSQKRQSRDVYTYPNGSVMVIGGMDRPGRFLSSEWDIIYAPECQQLDLDEWEMLVQRKARDGKYPYPQIRGDVNPDRPDHWIIQRSNDGKLTLLSTTHADNPKYWDITANDWTPLGREYVLGTLESLTGIRRERYLLGKWVSAEGAIYPDFDPTMHVIDPFEIPADWPRYRSVDFGYTNPFVCLWAALDPDGRAYVYREIYMSQRLVEDHARVINALSAGERYVTTIRDHDAEDGATLERYGIDTTPADKDVSTGIQSVAARLRDAGDGKPRVFFMRDALVEVDSTLADRKRPTRTVEEFGGYVWNDRVKREEPLKQDDHGMDALRYLCKELDIDRRVTGWRDNPLFA